MQPKGFALNTVLLIGSLVGVVSLLGYYRYHQSQQVVSLQPEGSLRPSISPAPVPEVTPEVVVRDEIFLPETPEASASEQ